MQLYSVRNSVGGHNGAAAHNSKAVLSVFIQSKAKNLEDKTHSRGIKPAGKNSKPRKEGTKVKTERTNQIRNAQLLFTQKTRQTGSKVKESLVDIHNQETQVKHVRDFTSGGSDRLIEICSCTWHITPSAEHVLQPRNSCMFENELYFYLN